MKDRLDELFYNVGRSLYDDEHVLLREKDFEWLIETVEEQQATIDTLSMAHDNMARELSLFKEKDKHELIKSNIALNERVQELEKENKRIRQMKYHEAYEQGKFDTNMKVWYEIPKLEQQNKRYREALEFYAEQDNYEWETSYRPQQEIDCMVIDDGGHTARKALEGESE